MAADPVLVRQARNNQDYDVEQEARQKEPKEVHANNDNTELQPLGLSSLARQAAWGLVEYHQKGNPVEIRARGTADHVFENLTGQFMAYGTNRVIAEHLAKALVDEAIARADEFKNKVKQKYIAVSAIVAEAFREDMYQFETGHTEVIIIDKNSADIAGSSGQEVRLTATGTATTSNRADVGQIFASVKKWALYIVQEAPGKEELDGVEAEMQAAIAAIGMEIGAGMDVEGLRTAIADLQELGALIPEIESMLATLVVLSEYAALEQTPQVQAAIAELSETLVKQMNAALEAGNIPLPLMQGVADYLDNFVQAQGLENVIDRQALSDLCRDIQKADVIQKLEAIAEGLDGEEAQAELKAMIAELDAAEGVDIKNALDALKEHLQTLNLPAEQMEMIAADIQKLDEFILKELPLEQKIEILADLAADELMKVLESLDSLEAADLPPQLAELLEKPDVQNLTEEELKEALAGQGELAETVQNIVMALNDPDIQVELPQAALSGIQSFMTEHSDFIETAEAQLVVVNLEIALEAIATDSPAAAEIKQVVERLEAGEKIDIATPAILEKAAGILREQALPQLTKAIEVIQSGSQKASVSPVALQVETIVALEVIASSGTLDTRQVEIVREVLKQPEAVSPKLVEQAVTTLGDRAPVEMIRHAQNVTPKITSLSSAKIAPIAAVASELKVITQAVSAPLVKQSGLSAGQKVPVEALKAAVRTLESMPENKPLSPAQAEVLLRKIDEGRSIISDPVVNQQIDLIREQIINRTEGNVGFDLLKRIDDKLGKSEDPKSTVLAVVEESNKAFQEAEISVAYYIEQQGDIANKAPETPEVKEQIDSFDENSLRDDTTAEPPTEPKPDKSPCGEGGCGSCTACFAEASDPEVKKSLAQDAIAKARAKMEAAKAARNMVQGPSLNRDAA